MALVTGGSGADALAGTAGIDSIAGVEGDDTISGGDGSDVVEGGPGADIIYGWGAADEQPDSGRISAVRVASGLVSPVWAVSPPGDADRLFVLEKNTGRVQLLDLNTGAVSTFLDVPDNQFSRDGERGALGLAFHPDYAANGRFFLFLTTPAGDLQVREYARGPGGSADASVFKVVITIPHPGYSNHNGGWLSFGPDGMLYLSTGDGGGSGDPSNNAQNPDSLLGKILRLDVNGDTFPNDPARNYAIPGGNPFVGQAGADEIWHLGLRNPFRASFDPLTGDLYIGDVGQSAREEVDFARAGVGGLNFGWRLREGTLAYKPETPVGPGVLTEPVLEYGRAAGPFGGVSIIGGVVNRGPGGAQGLYVFSDFVSGNLWTARVENGAAEDFLNRLGQLQTDSGLVNSVAAFAVDGRGRIYAVGLDGEVHRLDFAQAAGDGGDALNGGDGDDRIFGGAGADFLAGQEGSDYLSGGLDRDVLVGDRGDDFLEGGADVDQLYGGDGNDLMGGQDGADYLNGGAGRDGLYGDAGADFLEGGADDDGLFGQEGDDVIGGQDGADYLSGGAGRDGLYGDGGADFLEGGAGDDALHGHGGDDLIGGQDGADYISGGGGRDSLFGDVGADFLEGGAEDDGLFGQDGDDLIGGQDGADYISGGAGRDSLFGDAGADFLEGGSENDGLFGQGGDDLIGGQGGDDVLVGGIGNDRMYGDAGFDTAVFAGRRDSYVVTAAGNGSFTVSGADGSDLVSGVERLQFDDGFFDLPIAGAQLEPAGGSPTPPDWVL